MDGLDLIVGQLDGDGVGVDDLNDFPVEVLVAGGYHRCGVHVVLPNTHLPFLGLPEQVDEC